MIKHRSLVGEIASNKPNASTAFNLPDSAATGLRSFDAAYAASETPPYFATNGTDWEEAIGVFTAGTPDTLDRALLLDSSTGSFIDWSAGGDVTVFVSASAKLNEYAGMGLDSLIPGGRLSLSSSDPIGDSASATTIYYLPYIHNKICLWNGYFWQPVEFSSLSLALGTLTSGNCYDVFCYLSSGVATLELLAWTNDTTRATAVNREDGRWCKSGDKTRLLLGTFKTISTTATRDDGTLRYLSNVYNKISKKFATLSEATSHAYNSSTPRPWNNNTSNSRIEYTISIYAEVLCVYGCYMQTGGNGQISAALNSTTSISEGAVGGLATTNAHIRSSFITNLSTPGHNYLQGIELSYSNTTFSSLYLSGGITC